MEMAEVQRLTEGEGLSLGIPSREENSLGIPPLKGERGMLIRITPPRPPQGGTSKIGRDRVGK